MQQKILAALLAVLLLGGVPALQAAAIEKTELSLDELQKKSGFYSESAHPPVPWLTTEDCRWGVRMDGRLIYWGSYPVIRAESSRPALQRTLERRNQTQKEQHDAYAAEMGRQNEELTEHYTSYEFSVVDHWGRTDDSVVSFALRSGYYRNGEHLMHAPITTENINVQTGEALSLDEIITGREQLLPALAAAFRARYPYMESGLFEQNADKALAEHHKEANWQNGLQWMLNADNDLVVYYNPGDLLPAAAAQFELIVRRNKYPAVFR